MATYVPINFRLEEFFPKKYYEEIFPVYKYRMWTIIDERIKMAVQRIRDLHGPMIMNTWYKQSLIDKWGYYESRGYRPHDDDDVQTSKCPFYGNISQHRFGRAADLKPVDVTAEYIRKHMRENPKHPAYEGITRVEDTLKGKPITWLHIDCADTGGTQVIFLQLQFKGEHYD